MENIIYLDTHVVIWLYEGKITMFSPTTRQLLHTNDLVISPLVQLELQYLWEVKRITENPEKIIQELGRKLGLEIKNCDLQNLILASLSLNWMRDPFDRLITAQAILHQRKLLTKDSEIRKNCKLAFWD